MKILRKYEHLNYKGTAWRGPGFGKWDDYLLVSMNMVGRGATSLRLGHNCYGNLTFKPMEYDYGNLDPPITLLVALQKYTPSPQENKAS